MEQMDEHRATGSLRQRRVKANRTPSLRRPVHPNCKRHEQRQQKDTSSEHCWNGIRQRF
jgi:hypothetical protein